MTQEELNYIDTTVTTLTLLGCGVTTTAETEYELIITIRSNKDSAIIDSILYLNHTVDNSSYGWINIDKSHTLKTKNPIELCQWIFKYIS